MICWEASSLVDLLTSNYQINLGSVRSTITTLFWPIQLVVDYNGVASLLSVLILFLLCQLARLLGSTVEIRDKLTNNKFTTLRVLFFL